MKFLEALRGKIGASFKSYKENAKEIGIDEYKLYSMANGRVKMDLGTKQRLYSHFKLNEYGVEPEDIHDDNS